MLSVARYAVTPPPSALPPGAYRERVLLRRELRLSLFDERNAVLRVVEGVAAADARLPVVRDAPTLKPRWRSWRILDLVIRRAVVARASPVAADGQRHAAVADMHLGRPGGFARVRPGDRALNVPDGCAIGCVGI